MVHCCIGIMAYNEEANIGRLLDALRTQETHKVVIDEILVVASGCTDRTEEIVLEHEQFDPRIRLLRQSQREGKASAVNLLMLNIHSPVVVLESADTIPEAHTIESLVTPFENLQVGMTGGRPVPTNSKENFMGFAVHLLWDLHHQISLNHPKMGELVAYRAIFRQIPFDTAVDEASIEPLILGQGLRLDYVPEAVVYNHGPENLREFIDQRRRIFSGHLYVKDKLGYRVSTLNTARITWLFIRNMRRDLRHFIWGLGVAVLEGWARLLATYDYAIHKRKPYTWNIAESTKDLAEVS